MGRLGDLSPAASVAVGIIVGICSTLIQSLGLTLQRKSHIQEDSRVVEDERERRPPYRRRKWQIGMLMFIVANLVGSTIQITTLPLPVLSTLQASGLVFNTICASLILGEAFTRWSLIGTLMVAGGALLIAMFGAIPEPSHNLTQLLELLARGQFIGWMIGTGCLIAIILGIAVYLNRIQARPHSEHNHRTAARHRLWLGMCFGSISAILSAHSLLVAKSAVELLVRSIVGRQNQFNRAPAWFILLALVFLALSQLYFLHRGLKLASTSVLYPFVFCIYNIIAIIDGLIYFHQADKLTALHAGLIALGTVILLSGVLALSWRLGDDSQHSAEKHMPAAPEAAHTLLTPGMGLVEDTVTDDELTRSPSEVDSDEEDEEEYLQFEQTPLLQRSSSIRGAKKRRSQRSYQAISDAYNDAEPSPSNKASPPSPSTFESSRSAIKLPRVRKPRFSSDTIFATPSKRSNTIESRREANEIWDELQDSERTPTVHHRRASVGSALYRRRGSDLSSALSDGDDSDDETPASAPALRRAKTSETDGFRSARERKRRRRWSSVYRSASGTTPRRSSTFPALLFGQGFHGDAPLNGNGSVTRTRTREGSLGGWILDIWNRSFRRQDAET